MLVWGLLCRGVKRRNRSASRIARHWWRRGRVAGSPRGLSMEVREVARRRGGEAARQRGSEAQQRAGGGGRVPLARPVVAESARRRPRINLALMETGDGGRRCAGRVYRANMPPRFISIASCVVNIPVHIDTYVRSTGRHYSQGLSYEMLGVYL